MCSSDLDETTRSFLRREGREDVFRPLAADEGAYYDESHTIDLAELEPLIAMPHMPDVVKTVREVAGQSIDQVAIGSCTNSSSRAARAEADGGRPAPTAGTRPVHTAPAPPRPPGSQSRPGPVTAILDLDILYLHP